MKLISARSSRAPAPLSTANRAPDIRAARSKSRMPSAWPISQCGFGSKSNVGGMPHRRTSWLSAVDAPTGTLSCGRFGSVSRMAPTPLFDLLERRLALANLGRRAPCSRRTDPADRAPSFLARGDRLTGRVLLALEILDERNQRAPLLRRARPAPPAPSTRPGLAIADGVSTSDRRSRRNAGSSMARMLYRAPPTAYT